MMYMFEYSNEVLEQGLPLLVGNYSSSEVAKYVRTTRLNRIQITVRKSYMNFQEFHFNISTHSAW